MPILPKGAARVTTAEGGSPRGWTFISTGLTCWRSWALRYLFGLMPTTGVDALELGSAYHALMEGQSEEVVAEHFPDYIAMAKELAATRRDPRVAPLPAEAKHIEETFPLFDGLMTSKPDRIELDGRIRDYKTSFSFSQYDDQLWNTDGGIIGECMVSNATTGIVDIVRKEPERRKKKEEGEDAKPPDPRDRVKTVMVKLTPEKASALAANVYDFWEQLEARVQRFLKREPIPGQHPLDGSFTPSLRGCVTKYGPCRYYARCWEASTPQWFNYKLVPPPRKWTVGKPMTKKLVQDIDRKVAELKKFI